MLHILLDMWKPRSSYLDSENDGDIVTLDLNLLLS